MKLYNGDCLEVMQDIPNNSIDFILTDLPYGSTACKWDNIIPYKPMWKQIKRIRKNNTAIALFGTEPFTSHLILSNLDEFKYNWYWNKVKPSGHLVAKYKPMQKIEIISIFGKNKINYYPQMVKRDKPRTSKEYKTSEIWVSNRKHTKENMLHYKHPTTLVEYSNAIIKNRKHPTQKPIEILEYLIKTYTKENETVLDFTMGSGSTGVACVNTNRDFIGIELDKEYYNIAKERIDEKLYNNTN